MSSFGLLHDLVPFDALRGAIVLVQLGLVGAAAFFQAPGEGPVPVARPAKPVADLYAVDDCPQLTLTGLATFADPRASLATLRAEGQADALTVGQGEPVLDGRVLFIGADRVWIERPAPDGVCQVSLRRAAQPSPDERAP